MAERLYARCVSGALHQGWPPLECLNCGGQLTGEYCKACGQAASTGRLKVKEILGDALSHLFNIDAKIPRTVIGLTRNPGRIVDEYVAGRRVAYVSPLRYCLIAVAIVLLVYVALDISVVNVRVDSNDPDVEVQERMDEIRSEATRAVNARLNLVIFLALPLLALVVRWLFRRSGRNYAESLAYVLYGMGQVFVLGIPFGLLQPLSREVSVILRMVLQVVYLTWVAVGFFGQGWWRTGLKIVFASFLYLVAVALAVVAIAGPLVFELLNEAGVKP